jgi:hypothetical protein
MDIDYELVNKVVQEKIDRCREMQERMRSNGDEQAVLSYDMAEGMLLQVQREVARLVGIPWNLKNFPQYKERG